VGDNPTSISSDRHPAFYTASQSLCPEQGSAAGLVEVLEQVLGGEVERDDARLELGCPDHDQTHDLLAALAGWLVSGRQPPSIARQRLDA
jgi:hypothetical protein